MSAAIKVRFKVTPVLIVFFYVTLTLNSIRGFTLRFVIEQSELSITLPLENIDDTVRISAGSVVGGEKRPPIEIEMEEFLGIVLFVKLLKVIV